MRMKNILYSDLSLQRNRNTEKGKKEIWLSLQVGSYRKKNSESLKMMANELRSKVICWRARYVAKWGWDLEKNDMVWNNHCREWENQSRSIKIYMGWHWRYNLLPATSQLCSFLQYLATWAQNIREDILFQTRRLLSIRLGILIKQNTYNTS